MPGKKTMGNREKRSQGLCLQVFCLHFIGTVPRNEMGQKGTLWDKLYHSTVTPLTTWWEYEEGQ